MKKWFNPIYLKNRWYYNKTKVRKIIFQGGVYYRFFIYHRPLNDNEYFRKIIFNSFSSLVKHYNSWV